MGLSAFNRERERKRREALLLGAVETESIQNDEIVSPVASGQVADDIIVPVDNIDDVEVGGVNAPIVEGVLETAPDTPITVEAIESVEETRVPDGEALAAESIMDDLAKMQQPAPRRGRPPKVQP